MNDPNQRDPAENTGLLLRVSRELIASAVLRTGAPDLAVNALVLAARALFELHMTHDKTGVPREELWATLQSLTEMLARSGTAFEQAASDGVAVALVMDPSLEAAFAAWNIATWAPDAPKPEGTGGEPGPAEQT